MAGEMISTWPVVEELPLQAADRDASGFLTDDGVGRLFAAVRQAYLDGCSTLAGVSVAVGEVTVEGGSVPAAGDAVVAGAAVVEVFPDSFTMSTRIRPQAGEGIAAAATCRVTPEGGVTREIQAELIERAQTARHYH
jgi:hypothetical protein